MAAAAATAHVIQIQQLSSGFSKRSKAVAIAPSLIGHRHNRISQERMSTFFAICSGGGAVIHGGICCVSSNST